MPGVHVLSLYTLLLVNSLAPTIPHIHTQGQMHRNEKNEKKQREREMCWFLTSVSSFSRVARSLSRAVAVLTASERKLPTCTLYCMVAWARASSFSFCQRQTLSLLEVLSATPFWLDLLQFCKMWYIKHPWLLTIKKGISDQQKNGGIKLSLLLTPTVTTATIIIMMKTTKEW